MDYIGNKCPVCDNYFHIGDDIVVCPDCGTPAHRECYEKNGKCVNFEKHNEGYTYTADEQKNADGTSICKKCGAHNPDDAFFCSKCGNSLTDTGDQTQQPNQQAAPFGVGGIPHQNVIVIDPLAGARPEDDIGDGVTVGEMAKYVKQNTPYFIKIFSDIKNFSKSRFNFCGALFGGGYLLYRKMYKLGAFVTAIQAAMMILYMYIEIYISNSGTFDTLLQLYQKGDYQSVIQNLSTLSTFDTAIVYISSGITIASLVLTIVCGACVNRLYYNHCKKQISKIKFDNTDVHKRDTAYETKGGVNKPIALSLLVSYIAIQYLPYFFI